MDRVNNSEELYAKKFIEATMGFSFTALKLFEADETAKNRLLPAVKSTLFTLKPR